MPKAKGGEGYKTTGSDREPVHYIPTLADIGIDKKTSMRAQQLIFQAQPPSSLRRTSRSSCSAASSESRATESANSSRAGSSRSQSRSVSCIGSKNVARSDLGPALPAMSGVVR